MNVHRIACIGAGLIGQGWATVFSSKGFEVVLQDTSDTLLENSLREIRSNLVFLEANGFIAPEEAHAAAGSIEATTSMEEAVRHADYVQESVPDDYSIKKEVFRELDARASDHAILASSSSGLLMTEIQGVTRKPDRCVLVHPCLPVYLIPLVEIAGGRETSPGTVDAACRLMKTVGKIPVTLKREVAGYVVNRLQAALVREAIDLVDRGVVTAEEVDKAFCFGIGLRDPMIGPFLRIHLAGNGIEDFFRNYSESYHQRWATMETWTSIPASAVGRVIQGVREMGLVRTKTLNEIKAWRDEMLVRILRIMTDVPKTS